MLVRNLVDGRTGVTVPDHWRDCKPSESVVHWHGESVVEAGVLDSDLELVGPESPVANAAACGAGRGRDCCIFLTVGIHGLECDRHTTLRADILIRKPGMSAQRQPDEAFPACRAFPADVEEGNAAE
jgi:hypothetical protein